jgi:hypothetical protein
MEKRKLFVPRTLLQSERSTTTTAAKGIHLAAYCRFSAHDRGAISPQISETGKTEILFFARRPLLPISHPKPLL